MMKVKRFFRAFALPVMVGVMACFFGAGWAYGAESLTLEEALSRALEANPDVLSAREELNRLDGYYTTVHSGLLPSLSVSASDTEQEGTNGYPDRVTDGELALSQTVYSGGVVEAEERQALILKRQAEEKLHDMEETVAFDVYEAFLDVLQNRADLETAQDAFSYSRDYLKDMTRRRELGLATGLEVTRAEQQLESDRAVLASARNDLEVARIDVFTLLKLEPDAPFEITGDFDRVPEPGVKGASLETAMENRSDLKALVSERESQAENINIAAGNLKPTVSVSAGWAYTDYSPDDYDDEDEWFATLSVEIPLFDGGYTKGKVQQEKAVLKQADQAVIEKEVAIRAEVAQAWLTIESAAETVRASDKNVELAKESLLLAEVGYREGVNVQLDVLDARTSLTEARQQLASARKTHRMAVAGLWKAEGRLVSMAFRDGGENSGNRGGE